MNISIIDDHKLLADILKESLLKGEYIHKVNTYQDFEKLISHIKIFPIDLLITDMCMEDVSGLDVIRACRKIKSKKELKILVLSSIIDPLQVREAITLGANGYISKDAPLGELDDAIKCIMQGEKTYIGTELKDIIVRSQIVSQSNILLSPAEKVLLQQVCNGRNGKEIAKDMNWKMSKVATSKKQLMKKMNVNRTADLILKAIKVGLIQSSYAL